MFEKYEALKEKLASYERLIVAFSGGVDSSFLLKTAYEVLGDNVLAITAKTPYIANIEIEDAMRVADEIGARHLVLEKPWLSSIQTNPENRCYLCKHALFSALKTFAKEHEYAYVAEGSNVDDTREIRPGRQALAELGISTPLLDANLSKQEIRDLSKHMSLSTWDKPSYACLLTRFSHNVAINPEALAMVERAETCLIEHGYGTMRVRYMDGVARIEMEKNDALRLFLDERFALLIATLKSFGFVHVTLDLEGYRYQNSGIKGV